MNPEIKTRWLDALRSGDYAQTGGYLHDDHGYCCLGVLCDIAVQEGVVEAVQEVCTVPGCAADHSPWEYRGAASKDGRFRFSSKTSLPAAVVEWAGLDDPNPQVRAEEETRTLAGLNDEGQPFSLIADEIEEWL